MKYLFLKGGRLVDPVQGICGIRDILVAGDRIAAVTIDQASCSCPAGPESLEELDASGLVVMPGLVDLHVHLREPGQEVKETLATGCAAALAGGITSLACMANTEPVADNPETLTYILGRVRELWPAPRVFPLGALTRGLKGKEPADLPALARAGAAAFSDDGKSVVSSAVMARAMEESRRLGKKVFAHCEDPDLGGGVMNRGEAALRLGLPGIPGTAEDLMVARDLLLSSYTGCPLHIQHVSTAQAVDLVAWAKDRGMPVTAEATPHHLLLTEDAVEIHGTNAKMSPPLRTGKDRDRLIRGLKEGVIDCIATDHAPHTLKEKNRGMAAAPFGVSGLETALPSLITGLVEPGILSLEELVLAFSVAPARILGIEGGSLSPGSPADLVLVDMETTRKVKVEDLCSLGKNTPFLGEALRGWPVMTLVGGVPFPCRGQRVKGG